MAPVIQALGVNLFWLVYTHNNPIKCVDTVHIYDNKVRALTGINIKFY